MHDTIELIMFVRALVLILLSCESVFAGHADQVRYSIELNYSKGRMFADLKQVGEVIWNFNENPVEPHVSGSLTVKLPESYKLDDKAPEGEGWKRIDDQTLIVQVKNLEFKGTIGFLRKDPRSTGWKNVLYDMNVLITRSTSTPMGALGSDCDRAGLRVDGLGDIKRIPFIALQCIATPTDEIRVDAVIPKDWTPRFGESLKNLKPKTEQTLVRFTLPAIPRKSEKNWGEFWIGKGDFEVMLKIRQVPPPKKTLPYPPSRWQVGMMVDYMVYSENPDVGAVNWAGLRFDVDHKWRMFHRFLDWNVHVFLNESFTYRVAQNTDIPVGVLWGANAGLGPAFKNKWQKAFWTLHLGGFAYGMLTGAGNYGFDYLLGPYVDLLVRIPHGDVNIRRGVVVNARWSVLMETPSQLNLGNKHLQFSLEYWYNAHWAVKAQYDNLYYQSLANVNNLQWSNYGLGVVYAP